METQLIVWTVRISVALYAVVLWRWMARPAQTNHRDTVESVLWLASWAFCLVHVLLAFHFAHHWSHRAAMQHTAEVTARVTGWFWGAGIYANYAFLLWWGVDAVNPMLRTTAKSRSTALHAVAAFMMVNATAVFGPTWWIVPVMGFSAALLIFWRLRRYGRNTVNFRP